VLHERRQLVGDQTVRDLVRVRVHGVHPERGGPPTLKGLEEIEAGDPGLSTEPADGVVDVPVGVASVELGEHGPDDDDELAAPLAHPAVHRADARLRGRPALAVRPAVQGAVPGARSAVDPASFDPGPDERRCPRTEGLRARRKPVAPPTGEPVGEQRIAGSETRGLLAVVEDHPVDDDVRIEREEQLEVVLERGEVGPAPSEIEDFPRPPVLGVEGGLEHAWIGVGLLHSLAFGEGIPEHHKPAHAPAPRARLAVAELERVVAVLDGERGLGSAVLDPAYAEPLEAAPGSRIVEVQVEVAAWIRRIAVERGGAQPAAPGEDAVVLARDDPQGALEPHERGQCRHRREDEATSHVAAPPPEPAMVCGCVRSDYDSSHSRDGKA
jgi:hypothetical protein